MKSRAHKGRKRTHTRKHHQKGGDGFYDMLVNLAKTIGGQTIGEFKFSSSLIHPAIYTIEHNGTSYKVAITQMINAPPAPSYSRYGPNLGGLEFE